MGAGILIDLAGELNYAALSAPQTATATVTGQAYNLTGVIGSLAVVLAVGAVSGTAPSMAAVIQTSADGATNWTTLSGTSFAAVTTGPGVQVVAVDPRAAMAYIRLYAPITGTSPSFAFAALVVNMLQLQ